MNCETAWLLMNGHIDGQNTEAEEAALSAHLSACEDCRSMLAMLTGTEAGLASLQAQPPAALKEGVMQRIGKETSRKKRRSLLGPGSALGAVAAVLVLLLGTGVIKLPQRGADSAAEKKTAYVAELEPQMAAEDLLTSNYAGNNAGYDSLNGTEITGGTTDAPEAAIPEPVAELPTEAAEPFAETEASARRDDNVTLFSAEDLGFCTALSARYTVPVLAFYGLDEDFPAQLSALEPELGALLEDAAIEERDGRYLIELDVDTAFAIQEWLAASLPEDPEDDELPILETRDGAERGENDMIRRIEAFDPDSECLTTVVTLTGAKREYDWPAQWPKDFAACFRAERNWQLFYPEEDYLPEHGDLAYLVLIPLAEP